MDLNLKRDAAIDEADAAPVRPAATLVVLRDGAAGLEVLLLRRSRELSAFAGGLGLPRRRGGTGGRPGRRLADLSDHRPPRGRPGIGRRDRADRGAPGPGAPCRAGIAPVEMPRRFDTWFFPGELPPGCRCGSTMVRFMTIAGSPPHEALAQHRAGPHVVFPAHPG